MSCVNLYDFAWLENMTRDFIYMAVLISSLAGSMCYVHDDGSRFL